MKKLLPPPFPIGTKLEYTGNREVYSQVDGEMIPLIKKGIKVEITAINKPCRGLGKIGVDDEGDVIIDHDEDGSSVYYIAHNQGRLIRPENAHEWKII